MSIKKSQAKFTENIGLLVIYYFENLNRLPTI